MSSSETKQAASVRRRLRGLSDARARVETELEKAVSLARERGLTWTEIGVALGVSRQAVQKRYRHLHPRGDHDE